MSKNLEINSQKYHDLPDRAKDICECGGLLTGGVVAYLLDEAPHFKDIDIIVPVLDWPNISIPTSVEVKVNYYNGIHFVENGVSFDVWPADVFYYLQTAHKDGSKIRVYDTQRNKIIETFPVDKRKKIYKDGEDDIPF
jgi:hypothetical protein